MKTKQEIKEEISDLYAAQKAFSETAEFAHNQQMAAMKKMITLNQMLKDIETDMITEDHPIEYMHHVLLGGNPDTEHGHWLTEAEAMTNFARSFEELLKGNEGKLLFIRRAPKLESARLVDMDKIVYSMVGRFSVGKLKGKSSE